MLAIAEGFGCMVAVAHRSESEAFVARFPGVAVIRNGYRLTGQSRYIRRKRWFSIEPTVFGMRVALMIERFALDVEE